MKIGLQHCAVLKNAACFRNQDLSVITKPAIVAAAVATYLSAEARVGVRDKTGR